MVKRKKQSKVKVFAVVLVVLVLLGGVGFALNSHYNQSAIQFSTVGGGITAPFSLVIDAATGAEPGEGNVALFKHPFRTPETRSDDDIWFTERILLKCVGACAEVPGATFTEYGRTMVFGNTIDLEFDRTAQTYEGGNLIFSPRQTVRWADDFKPITITDIDADNLFELGTNEITVSYTSTADGPFRMFAFLYKKGTFQQQLEPVFDLTVDAAAVVGDNELKIPLPVDLEDNAYAIVVIPASGSSACAVGNVCSGPIRPQPGTAWLLAGEPDEKFFQISALPKIKLKTPEEECSYPYMAQPGANVDDQVCLLAPEFIGFCGNPAMGVDEVRLVDPRTGDDVNYECSTGGLWVQTIFGPERDREDCEEQGRVFIAEQQACVDEEFAALFNICNVDLDCLNTCPSDVTMQCVEGQCQPMEGQECSLTEVTVTKFADNPASELEVQQLDASAGIILGIIVLSLGGIGAVVTWLVRRNKPRRSKKGGRKKR